MIGRIHHSSRTVSDMERSLRFYRDLLGFKVIADNTLYGYGVSSVAAVPDTEVRIVMMDGGGACIELLQYVKPKGPQVYPGLPLNHVGSSHLAFEPDDMDKTYRDLVAKGVKFTGPPQVTWRGPDHHWRAAIFYDPDGLELALFKVSQGQPAEEPAAARA